MRLEDTEHQQTSLEKLWMFKEFLNNTTENCFSVTEINPIEISPYLIICKLNEKYKCSSEK